jgi:serine/threonine protein kinase
MNGSPSDLNGSRANGAGDWVIAARVRASIAHPHLIRTRIQRRGRRALVTELCSAPTLAERLAGCPLPLCDAVAVVDDVASAVQALAAHGLAPRELSPRSIHLHRTRGAILADTGVPATVVPRASVVSPHARGYLSPEELRGETPDTESFVYTLGAILLDSVPDELPRTLGRVIDRATADDPADRYEDPRAFASAATAATPGIGRKPERPRAPRRTRAQPRPAVASERAPALELLPSATEPARATGNRAAQREPAHAPPAKPGRRARAVRRSKEVPHPWRERLAAGPRVRDAGPRLRDAGPRLRDAVARAVLGAAALTPKPQLRLSQVAQPADAHPAGRRTGVDLPSPSQPRLPQLRLPRVRPVRLGLPRPWLPRRDLLGAGARQGAAAGAALVAAACALALSSTLAGDGDGASDGTTTIRSSAVRLDLPSGWIRTHVTSAGGVALVGGVSGRSPEERARFVAGLARDPRQVHGLVRAAVARGAVRRLSPLGGTVAWRWTSPRTAGTVTTLYVSYTSQGPLAALCRERPARPGARHTTCAAPLETLELTGSRVVSLGAVEEIRQELSRSLSKLWGERMKDRTALASAVDADDQVKAAESLELSFRFAAQTVAAIPTPRGTVDLSPLVASLNTTADSYRDLAHAISLGRSVSFDAARQAILENEARLKSAIRAAQIP